MGRDSEVLWRDLFEKLGFDGVYPSSSHVPEW